MATEEEGAGKETAKGKRGRKPKSENDKTLAKLVAQGTLKDK